MKAQRKYEIHAVRRPLNNQHLQELEADLMILRNIELNRLIACTPEKIDICTNTLCSGFAQMKLCSGQLCIARY